jgi:uncharacterized membrane-anchored protein
MAFLAAVVLVPLGREYADLRRSYALSRLGALATTALVLPAFAVSLVLALPLADFPVAQWLATVVTTLLVYSFATRAIVSSAAAAETAPSRSTRG